MKRRDERIDEAVYIRRYNGWFWVQWQGQHSYYYGPYKTRDEAEIWKTNKTKTKEQKK
jgi:hypothetical protein